DDDDEDDRREERREQVEEGDEPGPLADDVDEEDDTEAGAHLHRARAAEDQERAVDDVRDDHQVGDVDRDLEERAAREEVEQALEHQAPPLSSARMTASACAVTRTSWTRRALAPARAASTAAAIDAPRRSPAGGGGAPAAADARRARKDFRLAPTSTGAGTA